MFRSGDKVLHPIHGVATIEKIEEREVLNYHNTYYILNLFMKKMRIMVPVETADEVGIRRLSNTEHIEEAFDILKNKRVKEMPVNWNRRYKHNIDQIKTGDICKVAEVMKSLTHKEKRKGLSMGEKKMLDNVRQLLIGEIMLSKRVKLEKAATILDSAVH
ncbi:MAG: CarD family transcriptional regulator [bacterium]